jgi:hypothetical protein
MASPGWPALIAAAAVLWLCTRLNDAAERSQRPRIGLSAAWLSERSGDRTTSVKDGDFDACLGALRAR